MRFRFCGDQDCPDWVLAEIATLSKLTSVKLKLLCTQVTKDILGLQPIDVMISFPADAKFELGDVKACIAALNFILCSAAKHSVNEESLAREIQQLGLPKEHIVGLCKLYGDNVKDLQRKLQEETLKCKSVSHTDSIQWRVDYVIGSSHLKEVQAPMAQLCFVVRTAENPEPQTHLIALTSTKLKMMLNEMKQLYNQMEAIG